jgi:feruloyl-CoA synthase
VLSDAVITGQDRPFAGALAWLNATEARALLGAGVRPDGELVVSEELAKTLAQALAGHNAGAGSAARIERLAVLTRPPDLDAGEITDKGYINQRRVLDRRAGLIELLYADPPPPGVITPAAASAV